MANVAIVTGGGSGVGRAVALRLVQDGYKVGIVGRNVESLQETAKLAGGHAILPLACDVGKADDVDDAAKTIESKLGPAKVLVAAAGLNIPRRSWEVLNAADYTHVIETNLNGTFNWVRVVLPGMRKLGEGTIVAIVSDAGLSASAKAGAAYVASKFGQRGMVQSINAEERQHGIRATAVLPGDINTPLLDKRPVPPPMESRKGMLQPDDIVACVMLAITLPQRAIIEELLIRPR
jgi:NADP-dependent 3-hydroxy acid dehydrogenase YdfG